jgi:hypothetical protein
VWGADNFQEIRIRHTASAPDKWLEELQPALTTYANSSAKGVQEAIAKAREARLGDKLDSFLTERFGARTASTLKNVHQLEEGRPIETIWDVTTAATAMARSIKWQDERVEVEREAGKLLALAA